MIVILGYHSFRLKHYQKKLHLEITVERSKLADEKPFQRQVYLAPICMK